MVYSVSSELYAAGAFSGSPTASDWQSLSTANPQCPNPGITDTSTGSATYALPYSLQYTAPMNSAGTVTLYSVAILANYYSVLLPPLTLLPLVPPSPSAPINAPSNCLTTVGSGTITFVCQWTADLNDGGAFVSSYIASAFTSPEAVTPAATAYANSSTRSYPATFVLTFTTPPLTLGQVYIFNIQAINVAGASPALLIPMPNQQVAASNTLPVSGTSASISAGGVFGIIIGVLAAAGLLYLVARFYQRKGHFREHVIKHIPLEGEDAQGNDHEGSEDEDAEEDAELDDARRAAEDDEEEDLELGDADVADEEEDDEEQQPQHAQPQRFDAPPLHTEAVTVQPQS